MEILLELKAVVIFSFLLNNWVRQTSRNLCVQLSDVVESITQAVYNYLQCCDSNQEWGICHSKSFHSFLYIVEGSMEMFGNKL